MILNLNRIYNFVQVATRSWGLAFRCAFAMFLSVAPFLIGRNDERHGEDAPSSLKGLRREMILNLKSLRREKLQVLY
jgi:hypothetical protein